MKYPMYCYRDTKVGFMMPQCDQNDLTAKRGFAYAINNHEGVMNFAAKDYDLYKVGFFDTDTGEVISQVPELICSGAQVFGVDYK